MDSSIEDWIDRLIEAFQVYIPTLKEYRRLALCSELSEDDADCLEAIYTMAEQDSLLNFLINEFDRIWGKRIGLLDEQFVEQYKDQQAWLREHLEQTLFEQESRSETQRLLQDQGFYDGPIDGVWGDRSVAAIRQFREEVQRQLTKQGFYQGAIDGEFGQLSVSAVKEFQKSQQLKDDGIPGWQTFSALQSG
ncbi:peptidoglycan-binding protein [Oculatella sp. LEGE 06141]|uniref:peptidoglycan-binding domain-containing protein n=1 Tax=Oculatella sp. LEGE 06141 TaxID=1828648 RepID=UPI00187ED31E|nr:peptidoglycan-binding domain-containing protein [Oculatella sp. LEGE 06141]MBE9178971.1 peptidoglycan-binding protein [Oculatella sp. LEGE 06141]